MRTTLTLDDDVAARLQSEARRTGRPFKTVVNEHLRSALAQRRVVKTTPSFEIASRKMGGPVLDGGYDDISSLIDRIEGPRHR